MSENLVFLVIFDTCDVVYNWSLLPPIVLDNLFLENYARKPGTIYNSRKPYLLEIIYPGNLISW